MHEKFRTAAGGNARPERVGEREVVDQIAGARFARPGDLDNEFRRLCVRRSQTQCVRHKVERVGSGRDENSREIQAYGGEKEPGQVFRSGRTHEQGVEPERGAKDFCLVRDPLPLECYSTPGNPPQ
jgi:hypothetical protein